MFVLPFRPMVNKDVYISHNVVAIDARWGGIVCTCTSSKVYHRMQKSKNYWNRTKVAKVIVKWEVFFICTRRSNSLVVILVLRERERRNCTMFYLYQAVNFVNEPRMHVACRVLVKLAVYETCPNWRHIAATARPVITLSSQATTLSDPPWPSSAPAPRHVTTVTSSMTSRPITWCCTWEARSAATCNRSTISGSILREYLVAPCHRINLPSR